MSDQPRFLGREPGFDTANTGVGEGEMPRICHESHESCEPRVGKHLEFKGLRKRASGFEPPTSSLGSWHSTTELRPHDPSRSSESLAVTSFRFKAIEESALAGGAAIFVGAVGITAPHLIALTRVL